MNLMGALLAGIASWMIDYTPFIPNYALGMHSLPRGLTIRLRRMSRLNLVTLAVRVRHLSSDLTMKITNLVFLLGAKSLIFIRQLCNADSTVSIA
jgi:hypothetical protein